MQEDVLTLQEEGNACLNSPGPTHQLGMWPVGLESLWGTFPAFPTVLRVAGASPLSPFTERNVAVQVRWWSRNAPHPGASA